MIKFNITRMLNIKGITRPTTYLLGRGHSPSYVHHLIRNNINSVSLKKLYMMCSDFNCTPNDLLDYDPGIGKTLPSDHALHGLTKTDTIAEVSKLLQDLPMEKIAQLYKSLKEGNPEENKI